MNFQIYSLWQYSIAALLLVLATGGHAAADSGEGTLFTHDRLLTPRQLVAAVLARNPTLPAMQAAWQAAQSRIEPAAALDDPMLSYAVAPRTAPEKSYSGRMAARSSSPLAFLFFFISFPL